MMDKLKQRGPLVAGAAGAVLILLMVVGLILPRAAAVKTKQDAVARAKSQEATLRTQLQQLVADAKGSTKDMARLRQLEAEVPTTADLPGIIRLLNDAAGASAVDFMAVAPGQPQLAVDGSHSTVPASITIDGPYFSLDQFLYKLEGLPRISRVLSVSLGPGAATGGLQLQVTAEFYTTDNSSGPGSVPGPSETNPLTGAPETPPPSPASNLGGD